MAKHRRQGKKVVRNTAAVTATAAVATLTPMAAHAAEVVVPGTDFRMDVQGLEGVQGLANVPGVDNYVPSLKGQGGTDFAAAIANPQAQPFQTQSVGESILAAARSFDCSGLTTWAYNQVGKKIPRTSYGQAAEGQKVSRENLQPGDIVVFYSGASHVGIYAGNGKVVHAVTQGTPLQEAPMDNMPFHSAVRF